MISSTITEQSNIIYINEPILESAQPVLKEHGGLEKAIGLYGFCTNESDWNYITAVNLYLVAQDGISFAFPAVYLKEFLNNKSLQIPEKRRTGVYVSASEKKLFEFDQKQIRKKKGIRDNEENKNILDQFVQDNYGKRLGIKFREGSPDGVTIGDTLTEKF